MTEDGKLCPVHCRCGYLGRSLLVMRYVSELIAPRIRAFVMWECLENFIAASENSGNILFAVLCAVEPAEFKVIRRHSLSH